MQASRTSVIRTFCSYRRQTVEASERPRSGERSYVILAVLLMVSSLTGCRICADCEDRAYPTYGGLWQRTIRDHGRVGSLFDPAGGLTFDLAARNAPPGADELEREKYRDRSDISDPEDLDDEVQDREGQRDEQGLRERQENLRDRDLDEIEVPDEQERRDKELDEIDVRIIRGTPNPPVL